jgi:hypothetical protein
MAWASSDPWLLVGFGFLDRCSCSAAISGDGDGEGARLEINISTAPHCGRKSAEGGRRATKDLLVCSCVYS